MRTETWYGYEIRFVEINGEWYAILKDICDALKLRTNDVAQRIDPDMLERVLVEATDLMPTISVSNSHKPKRGERKTMWMLAVNEAGIYQALFASRKLEARKFQLWTFDILKKLRKSIGLQGYEVMRMTESETQNKIDWILDGLYWDEENKCIMYSKTIQGGDVEQIPFDQYIEENKS